MMEEMLKKKPVHNFAMLDEARIKEAEAVSLKVKDKYGPLIASAVIKKTVSSKGAVDAVFIIDDFNSIVVAPQVADVKVAASEYAYSSSIMLNCDVVLASAVWSGLKSKDDSIVGLMRDSLVVYDNGFFLPCQELLVTGKIRPSKESVRVYFVKAENSVKSSGGRVDRAVLDLYWAVIDSAHAAVMIAGITPPSPKDLAETIKRDLVKRNLVHKRCGDIVDKFYNIAKRIMHKEIFGVSGREFDELLADADFFIKEMDEFVKEHAK